MPSSGRGTRGDNVHELFGSPEITIDPWLTTPRVLHASRKRHVMKIMQNATLTQPAYDLIMYGCYRLNRLVERRRLSVVSLYQLGFGETCPWDVLACSAGTFRARYRFQPCPPEVLLAACGEAPEVPYDDSALFYMYPIQGDEDAPPRVLGLSRTLDRVIVSATDADDESPLMPSQKLIVTLL